MPFGGLLTGGIGAAIGGLAGLFGGGKQQTVNTNSTTNQSSNMTGSGSQVTSNYATPQLSSIQQAMLNSIMGTATNNLNNATNLTGYGQQGLEQINQGGNAAAQAMQANLASKGQQFSPAGTTAQNQQTLARTGQQSQFLQQLPLLQTQLSQQALQQMMQGFQIQPTATTSGGVTNTSQNQSMSGTSNTQGTQSIYGNPMGGLMSGIGSGLFGGLALGNMFPNMFSSSGGGVSGLNALPGGGMNLGTSGLTPSQGLSFPTVISGS